MNKEKYHLQLFMSRVLHMRDLQKQYFAGNRNVFNEAKAAEKSVDSAIAKLCSDLGYTLEEIKKYEQTKIF